MCVAADCAIAPGVRGAVRRVRGGGRCEHCQQHDREACDCCQRRSSHLEPGCQRLLGAPCAGLRRAGGTLRRRRAALPRSRVGALPFTGPSIASAAAA
eukprot:365687-Chlamydomonas_euryale.AAC.3